MQCHNNDIAYWQLSNKIVLLKTVLQIFKLPINKRRIGILFYQCIGKLHLRLHLSF